MPRIFLFLLLLPIPSGAEEVLTPDAFDEFSRGKTLYFAQQGQSYGAEQYLPNRQSVWQFADGSCTRGFWYGRDDLICFVYEGDQGEYCWNFLKKGNSFAARALGREPEADLDVVWQDRQAVICTGPEVGT